MVMSYDSRIRWTLSPPFADLTLPSLELVCPKDVEDLERYRVELPRHLLRMSRPPCFISVTCRGNGTNLDLGIELCRFLRSSFGIPVVKHLVCQLTQNGAFDHFGNELTEIDGFLALRGDLSPEGCDVNTLLALLRQRYPSRWVAVAGYPSGHPDAIRYETPEIAWLKEKSLRADLILTQITNDADAVLRFIRECRDSQISNPIRAGLCYIHSLDQAAAIEKNLHVSLSKELTNGLAIHGTEYGLAWSVQLGRKLLQRSVPLHIYAMGRSRDHLYRAFQLIRAIYE